MIVFLFTFMARVVWRSILSVRFLFLQIRLVHVTLSSDLGKRRFFVRLLHFR